MNKNQTLFIVDDDQGLLDFYKGIFGQVSEPDLFFDAQPTSAHLDVHYFDSPIQMLEAHRLALTEGHPPALCMLDIRMPELDGIQAAEILRSRDPYVNLLICSAHSDYNSDELSQKFSDNFFFIQKPCTEIELLSMTKALIALWNKNADFREKTKALEIEEQRLAFALQGAEMGYWDWFIAKDEVYVNPQWYSILGRTSTTMSFPASEWVQMLHPEDRSRVLASLEAHLAQESPLIKISYRLMKGDGSYGWYLDQGRISERDAQGNPLRVSGLLMNITESKSLELEIIRQNAALAAVLTSVDDIILEVDINGIFLNLWSNNSKNLLFEPNYFLGKPALSVLGPQLGQKLVDHIHLAQQNQQSEFDYEVEINGEMRWFCAKISKINNNHLSPNFSCRIQDIQNRKNEELALRVARAEALQASEAKSLFLATMSHEIRTPLNGVIHMSSLLNDTQLDSFQKDLCSTLKTSAETLLFLVNDILDFSKIEAGQMQIEELPISSNDFLGSLHSLLANQAQEKGLELHIENNILDKAFIGDPIRLRQIVLNFASNALKFTAQGSVTLRLELQQRLLRFEVHDTGIGLTLEQQQKLFSNYTQADTSTSRHFGGTGLGLAICKKLALLMNGSVGVNSELHKGSVFWLQIPWRPTHIQEAPKSETVHKSLHSDFHILVVDDNKINLKVARLLIQKMGTTCTTVTSGFEALELQRQEKFDAVLMDMIMPDLNGLETTERWRTYEQQNSLSPTPIFALTANVTPQDHENCKNAGMNGLLTKPIQAEHLRQTLLNVQEHLFP